MPWTKVAHRSDLPVDTVLEVFIGPQPYAICNDGGEIRALNGICVHHGGPLGQGQVHQGHVVCPYHLWEFDCRTGEYDYDPTKRVATYPVKLDGDDILIETP